MSIPTLILGLLLVGLVLVVGRFGFKTFVYLLRGALIILFITLFVLTLVYIFQNSSSFINWLNNLFELSN